MNNINNYTIFNTIKSQVPLLDVVNYYTTLKQAGIYWKGYCPFHQEKTPSFTVSPHINIFYCFGCHESGDVISFIAKIENSSQLEAAYQLAHKYNIAIETNREHSLQTNTEKYQIICSLFTQWCLYHFNKSKEASEYLLKRGFQKELLERFEVGYMPGEFHIIKTFIAYCQKKSILLSDLIEAGIIIQTKNSYYSPFQERIIFPIKDHLNRYCGFGGRIFKADDERVKYYNSKEHEFFNKSNILFGLNHARSAIQEKNSVFLVEGYTDCIAMAQLGYTNTVATLGTACTQSHLKILTRYTHELIIIYDNDQAGIKGISKIASMCWNSSIEPKVVQLQEGKDPATFLEKSDLLSANLANPEDIFIFAINQVTDNYKTLSLQERVHHVDAIIKIIETIDDPLKQNILFQHASEKLAIPFDILLQKFEEQKKMPHSLDQNNSSKKSLEIIKTDTNKAFYLEKKLFCTIANNPKLIKIKQINMLLSYMPQTVSEPIERLQHWIIKHNEEIFNFQAFFEAQPEDLKKNISMLLCSEEGVEMAEFEILLKEIQKKWWKEIVFQLKRRIEEATRMNNKALVRKLIEEFTNLQKNMVP